MGDNNGGNKRVSRRDVMKATAAGAGVGISGVSGVAAWEDADPDTVAHLETLPEVRSILDELELAELPEPQEIRQKNIGEAGEIVVRRVELEFGTLRVGEVDDDVDAAFVFDDENRSALPPKYRDVPRETNATLSGTADDTIFRRMATEREKNAALSTVPTRGDGAAVYTGSDVDGFYVDVFEERPDSDVPDIRRYKIETTASGRDLWGRESRTEIAQSDDVSRQPVTALSDSVSPAGLAEDIIIDQVSGILAAELGDLVGPCGQPCTECADYLISLLTDCHRCRPVCASGSTGAGAILCVACFYTFCSLSQITSCMVCADCAFD